MGATPRRPHLRNVLFVLLVVAALHVGMLAVAARFACSPGTLLRVYASFPLGVNQLVNLPLSLGAALLAAVALRARKRLHWPLLGVASALVLVDFVCAAISARSFASGLYRHLWLWVFFDAAALVLAILYVRSTRAVDEPAGRAAEHAESAGPLSHP